MKIIAFDSTAKAASVAVTEDKKLLALYTVDNGLTQSELLLPMAESLLSSLKLSFKDIELFSCCVGPGSFTGVRIGAAMIKGLAFGRNVPCVGVSTIESLAYNLKGLDGIIVPCMDARRAQVYTAVFECKGGELKRITEDEALPLSELCEILKAYSDKNIYICGDGYDVAYTALTKLGITLAETPYLLRNENAFSCAVIAYEKYTRGEYTDDSGIAPVYLRLPQAERERIEKNKKTT